MLYLWCDIFLWSQNWFYQLKKDGQKSDSVYTLKNIWKMNAFKIVKSAFKSRHDEIKLCYKHDTRHQSSPSGTSQRVGAMFVLHSSRLTDVKNLNSASVFQGLLTFASNLKQYKKEIGRLHRKKFLLKNA